MFQSAIAKPDRAILDFEGAKVRFVGTAERPEWIAADICSIAEIENVSRALADFDEDEKGIHFAYTPGGTQRLLTVYEPGLYRLLAKSRTEAAKRFKRWLFHQVLPSIRKHGTYPPPTNPAVAALLPWGHRFRQTFGAHLQYMGAHHPGSFTIFSALAGDLMHAEEVLARSSIPTSERDRPDVSAGLMWAADRRRRGMPEVTVKAPLFLPVQDFDTAVNVFDGSEWKSFATWFRAQYIPANFVAYLLRKAEWKDVPQPARLAAADAVSLAIVGRHAELPAPKRRAVNAQAASPALFEA